MALRANTRRPVRFRAGVKRLSKNLHPATIGATKDLREQMKVLEKRLRTLMSTVVGATPDAIEAALLPIAEEASILVPFDTGDLHNSIYLETQQTATGAVGEIGFGASGPSVDYAVQVHENLEMRHEAPTQAKFLEKPLNDQLADIPGRLRNFMRLT